MQAGLRRLINQGVIGQLWPRRPQSVEHILLLLGLLARTNWTGGKKGKQKSRQTEKDRNMGDGEKKRRF